MKSQIPWKEAKGRVKENALVYDGDCPAGYIFAKNGKFIFLQVSDIMQTPFLQFFDKAFFEKFDENIDEETNNLRKNLMKQLLEDNKK